MRYSDAASALDGVLFDGMTVMAGGFGMAGSPEKLLVALVASGVTGLTLIANSCGTETTGVGPLIANGQVKKLIAGPGVYICDECIDLCNEIIEEEFSESLLKIQPAVRLFSKDKKKYRNIVLDIYIHVFYIYN